MNNKYPKVIDYQTLIDYHQQLIDDSFSTKLFPTIQENRVKKTFFDPGTFNVIGAPTGSGITSALCSLTAEALLQGRNVAYFVNNEPMDCILAKIQLSMLAQKYFYEQNDTDPLRSEDPFWKYIELIVKQKDIKDKDYINRRAIDVSQIFGDLTSRGPDGSGKFVCKDYAEIKSHAGSELEYFEDLVSGLPKGSIIILDYLQGWELLPEETGSDEERQRRMVRGIKHLAWKTGNIFICDALFHPDKDCQEHPQLLDIFNFDKPDEVAWMSAIAIGINRVQKPGCTPEYYYQIVKDNHSAPTGPYWLDKTGYPYGFLHAKKDQNGMLCRCDVF